MKQNIVRNVMGMMVVAAISAALCAGCGANRGADAGNTDREGTDAHMQTAAGEDTSTDADSTGNTDQGTQTDNSAGDAQGATELIVRFGDQGEPFTMHLLENETAAAVARYVGTSDWRLPIYERDDDVDYDVLQYYDIPSQYDIPSNAETVTEAKAGDVFYSDPNRIVLFYHNADISEEYTKIGTFDPTDEFIAAVEENPVLEGWGNKIVLISQP